MSPSLTQHHRAARGGVELELPVRVDGVTDTGIDTGVAAVAFRIGIEKELMGYLVVGVRTVAENRLVGGEVDDEDQVRALGDNNFVRMIDVQ